jgi:GDP/UDP-N,N'-diacetylbacillosamine 2-epimerase (hydrolysing)
MAIKKICIVTAARSEYGLLRWLMQEIKDDPELKLQLIVTGSHLSNEFGLTYKEIEKDGFIIDEKIEMLLSTSTATGIAKSMGICAIGIADAFDRLNPDILVVLGDRYELLPICSSALVMNIPIAHISGGDVTEGAIDDQVRNAITKLATIHFPGTEESAKRIIQMGENPKMVHVVGEPGLDNFVRLNCISKQELASDLKLDMSKKWVLLTYHPETKISIEENLIVAKNIITALLQQKDIQVVITKANADLGGSEINIYLKSICEEYTSEFTMVDNLGQLRYISLLKVLSFMIGNSSSGIVETPIIPLPVINVGNRQKGRFVCKNIINTNGTCESMINAIETIRTDAYISGLRNIFNPFGEGNASEPIKNILKNITF